MIKKKNNEIMSDSSTPSNPRKLFEIANEIEKEWKNKYFGAIPYLNAMKTLSTIEDNYFDDDAHSIIIYFLLWDARPIRSLHNW